MKDERGPWYLLTGVVIGSVLGLLYAWVLQPVQYTNTSPTSLRADYKDRYRAMIAYAFTANGDLVRAKARLALLKDEDAYRAVAEQAQRTLAEGNSNEEARALGLLAASLAQGPAAVATQPSTAATHSPIAPTALEVSAEAAAVSQTPVASASEPSGTIAADTTNTPTSTSIPTRTSLPTLGGPFVLTNRELLCQQGITTPVIQVLVFNSSGEQMPGVEIVVTWEGGENHFYTGLKPEVGAGYADFSMTPSVTYNLRLAIGGQSITDLTAQECQETEGTQFWGIWRLEFVQP